MSDAPLDQEQTPRRPKQKSFAIMLTKRKRARLNVRSAFAAAALVLGAAMLPASAGERLITLGTAGGPAARMDRGGISTLLEVNGTFYLFDAGQGFTSRLQGIGVNLGSIRRIFLTHLHDDHYAGLASFVGELWTLRPTEPVEIYGPPLIEQVVQHAVDFQAVNGAIREVERKFPHSGAIFQPKLISEGEFYKDENIAVSAIENTHFHFPADTGISGKTKSLSFKITTPDRTIVITGDTGSFAGLKELSKGADLLVTEVTDPDEVLKVTEQMMGKPMQKDEYERRKFHQMSEHMTPETVAELATAAGVKHVILTHFPPRIAGDKTFKDFAERVGRGFPGKITASKDLDQF